MVVVCLADFWRLLAFFSTGKIIHEQRSKTAMVISFYNYYRDYLITLAICNFSASEVSFVVRYRYRYKRIMKYMQASG